MNFYTAFIDELEKLSGLPRALKRQRPRSQYGMDREGANFFGRQAARSSSNKKTFEKLKSIGKGARQASRSSL